MLRIVDDPMLHREVALALFHPLDFNVREDFAQRIDESHTKFCPNLNRRAMQILFRAGGRLSIMTTMFWIGISSAALKLAFLDRSNDSREEDVLLQNNEKETKKKTYSRVFILLSKLLYEWNDLRNTNMAAFSMAKSDLVPFTKFRSSTGSFDDSKFSYGSSSPLRTLSTTPSQRLVVENREDKEETEASLNLSTEFVNETALAVVNSGVSALSAQLEGMIKTKQALLSDILLEDESLILRKTLMTIAEENSTEPIYTNIKTLLSVDAENKAAINLTPTSIADSIFFELSRCVDDHPTVVVQVYLSSIHFKFVINLNLSVSTR